MVVVAIFVVGSRFIHKEHPKEPSKQDNMREVEFGEQLRSMIDRQNRDGARMLDGMTRLEYSVAGPGRLVTFNCTEVNVVKSDVNVDWLKQNFRDKVVADYKNSAELKWYRENKVELHYVCMDKEGLLLFENRISPDEN